MTPVLRHSLKLFLTSFQKTSTQALPRPVSLSLLASQQLWSVPHEASQSGLKPIVLCSTGLSIFRDLRFWHIPCDMFLYLKLDGFDFK